MSLSDDRRPNFTDICGIVMCGVGLVASILLYLLLCWMWRADYANAELMIGSALVLSFVVFWWFHDIKELYEFIRAKMVYIAAAYAILSTVFVPSLAANVAKSSVSARTFLVIAGLDLAAVVWGLFNGLPNLIRKSWQNKQ